MNDSPTGRVIILTGPPGAGKSTVAPLLADRLDPGVHLHTDDFWGHIRRGRIEPFLPDAQLQNEVVVDVIARAAFGYAAGGYHVICDGVIGPWFLDVFVAAASTTAIPLHYAILRPDVPTTLARATRRGDGALTAPDPITSLHDQFSDLGLLERHVVDSTLLTPSATADAVLSRMDDFVLIGQ